MLIALEGIDGSGKTTQVKRLAELIHNETGRQVITTREPGGTAGGEAIRAVVFDVAYTLTPEAQLLLMIADKVQHQAEVIQPALDRGAIVITDRSHGSTLAYQGYAQGIPTPAIQSVMLTCGLRWADVNVWLEIDPLLARERKVPGEDRYEQAGRAFMARVHRGYMELSRLGGWVTVNADDDEENVTNDIWDLVKEFV